MTELRRLSSRFPCCGVACTHKLEVGVPRTIACARCRKRYVVELVECGEHVQALAGRPVAKVEWKGLAAA